MVAALRRHRGAGGGDAAQLPAAVRQRLAVPRRRARARTASAPIPGTASSTAATGLGGQLDGGGGHHRAQPRPRTWDRHVRRSSRSTSSPGTASWPGAAARPGLGEAELGRRPGPAGRSRRRASGRCSSPGGCRPRRASGCCWRPGGGSAPAAWSWWSPATARCGPSWSGGRRRRSASSASSTRRPCRLMLRSRALVFPTWLYEGQPMSVLEAFAAGLPVLALPPRRERRAGRRPRRRLAGPRTGPGRPGRAPGRPGRRPSPSTPAGAAARRLYEERFAERHNLRALEAAYRYCTIRSRSLR